MVKQNSASELVKLTPTRLYRVGFLVLWALRFPSRASSSNPCSLISVSFWTHFKEGEKGLKPGITLWTGIYYIWACFEFRISGSSSRTSENLRDGNSPGIKTGLVSKFLTSRNAKPWVQSEFRLSSRIIWGVSAASSRASHPRQPFGDSR